MQNKNMHNDEDSTIITAILQGNVECYRQLLDKYEKIVSIIVSKRVPEDMVATIVHDVFVRVYKALDKYRNDQHFAGWLSRIAIRTCYDFWRDRKRYESRHVSTELSDDQQNWLEQAAVCNRKDEADYLTHNKDACKVINWVLDQLQADDRTLIESIYFEDMKLKEIAEVLNWSLVKTKVRAMRARRRMRAILESTGDFL